MAYDRRAPGPPPDRRIDSRVSKFGRSAVFRRSAAFEMRCPVLGAGPTTTHGHMERRASSPVVRSARWSDWLCLSHRRNFLGIHDEAFLDKASVPVFGRCPRFASALWTLIWDSHYKPAIPFCVDLRPLTPDRLFPLRPSRLFFAFFAVKGFSSGPEPLHCSDLSPRRILMTVRTLCPLW